jgi:hypothetical protein
MIELGIRVVWGIPEGHRQVVGLPADALAVRYRFRNDDVGRCFVRTKTGIHCYVLCYPDGMSGPWGLIEEARNERLKLGDRHVG